MLFIIVNSSCFLISSFDEGVVYMIESSFQIFLVSGLAKMYIVRRLKN